jgi:hypothetical protein
MLAQVEVAAEAAVTFLDRAFAEAFGEAVPPSSPRDRAKMPRANCRARRSADEQSCACHQRGDPPLFSPA